MSDLDPDDPFAMSAASSPSSSPGSSPSLWPVDSSPPSSPSIGPVATPPESPGPLDPYAGLNKWNRPPQYDVERAKPLGWDSGSVCPQRDETACDHPFATPSPMSGESSMQDHSKTHRRTGSHCEHGRNASPSSLGPMDPYAASAGGAWSPPRREKKPPSHSVSATSAQSTSTILSDDTADSGLAPNERSFSQKAVNDDDDVVNLNDEPAALPQYRPSMITEEEIWEKAIATAIEKADGEVYLQNSSLMSNPLTYIPSFISDLAGLVVLPSPHTPQEVAPIAVSAHRPFIRSATVPVSSSRAAAFFDDDMRRKALHKAGSTALVRTATSAMLPKSTSRNPCELKLFLSGNKITSLPLELFQLIGLTVLALRSNCISVMPFQIAQFTNLRELNIPFNKLSWLPSEMLGMQPMRLRVTNNTWIQPPPPDEDPNIPQPPAQSQRTRTGPTSEPTRTCVSPTTVHFDIPPLTEFCFRLLLSPIAPDSQSERRPETILEAFYALPLSLSGKVCAVLPTLRACLPSAVAKPADEPSPPKKARSASPSGPGADRPAKSDGVEEPPPGIGVCPSPVHRTPDGGWVNGRVPVFVRHAEERFTWEREIAGADLKAECAGAGVPVRWRGCWRGCLDFLDPEQEQADDEVVDVDMDGGEERLEADMAVSEPGGDSAAVHTVQFVGGPIGEFEDFE